MLWLLPSTKYAGQANESGWGARSMESSGKQPHAPT